MEAARDIGAAAGMDFGFGRLAAFGLRMRVRWSRDRLTRELARGAPSIDSRELALRAGQLTAKTTREVVAASIEDLLHQVDRPRAVLTSQVPVDRRKLKAVRGQLEDLLQRLRSPHPVRARGMALVLLLLTDPEQPLYGIGGKKELSRAIIDTRERLDESP